MKLAMLGLLVSLGTAAYAQAPEQIPDRRALYARGKALDAEGRAIERSTEEPALRREAVELRHRGAIDKQRALDVDPQVYRQDDTLLRRALRSR